MFLPCLLVNAAVQQEKKLSWESMDGKDINLQRLTTVTKTFNDFLQTPRLEYALTLLFT